MRRAPEPVWADVRSAHPPQPGIQYRPVAPAACRYSRAAQATRPRRSQRRQPASGGGAMISVETEKSRSSSAAHRFDEAGVLDHHVGLQVDQQRQRVDVGAAHGGPVAIDQRHLGVQESGRVLEDAHAAREQLVVEGLGREAREPVVDLALQQQPHLHPALGRRMQRAAKRQAWVEVGADDVDALGRTAQGVDVGALDAAALAQVVAHDEGRAHRRQRGSVRAVLRGLLAGHLQAPQQRTARWPRGDGCGRSAGTRRANRGPAWRASTWRGWSVRSARPPVRGPRPRNRAAAARSSRGADHGGRRAR